MRARCSRLAVEGVAGEDEAAVDGDALAFVDGERVAVADVAGVEVAGRKLMAGVVVGADRDRSVVRIDVGDGADGPVADPDTTVVAHAQDTVAGLEGEVVDVRGQVR